MAPGVKVTREGPGLSLPGTLGGSSGVPDGDDIDWEDGGGAPGSIPGGGSSGDFELNIEGGQSVIKPHGSMGSTETFDPTDGNVHTGTLTADCTVTLNAPAGSGAALLELWLTQDGTGGWDITWPGSVTVNGTPDTTASTTTVWLLDTVDGGTTWVAFIAGGDAGEPTADAHIVDTTDAHDASAISIVDAGSYYTGTDVEAALQELPPLITAAAATAAAAAGGSHVHVMDCLFSGDASTTAWTLPVAPFDQYSVAAYVSGVLTEVTLSGTVFDIATFGSAPASATNNIRFDITAAVV